MVVVICCERHDSQNGRQCDAGNSLALSGQNSMDILVNLKQDPGDGFEDCCLAYSCQRQGSKSSKASYL